MDAAKLWQASRSRGRAHRRRAGDPARAAHRRARGRVRPADGARRGDRRPPARSRGGRPARRGARGARPRSAPRSGWPPLAAPIGQILASQALLQRPLREPLRLVVDELRALVAGPLRHAARRRSTRRVARAVSLRSDGLALEEDPPSTEDVRARGGGARRERGGARSCSRSSARRPSRCCARSAAGTRATSRSLAERRRPGPRRADPRARPDRPGERASAEVDDRGDGDARLGAADARIGEPAAAPTARSTLDEPRTPAAPARARRRHRPRRVADGRHLLPGAAAGRAAVRRGRRHGRRRARRSASSRR